MFLLSSKEYNLIPTSYKAQEKTKRHERHKRHKETWKTLFHHHNHHFMGKHRLAQHKTFMEKRLSLKLTFKESSRSSIEEGLSREFRRGFGLLSSSSIESSLLPWVFFLGEVEASIFLEEGASSFFFFFLQESLSSYDQRALYRHSLYIYLQYEGYVLWNAIDK